MKTFNLLLVSIFLLFCANAAYAAPFAIDLDGDGDLDTYDSSISQYIPEIDYHTYGIVDLYATAFTATTVSGTFNELAALKISADEFKVDGTTNTLTGWEMTIIMEGSGNFSADWDGTDIGDQSFNFKDGQISIYIDDQEDFQSANNTDGAFYGADNSLLGSPVAVFDLQTGYGSLQATPGETDNVDIWSLSSDVLEEDVFFFEDMIDFFDVSDVLAGIFIQLYTNDTNELLASAGTILDLESELAEAIADGKYTEMTGGNQTARVYVESEGSAEFNVVPEPATMMLFGFGLLGLAGITRRKNA